MSVTDLYGTVIYVVYVYKNMYATKLYCTCVIETTELN